MMVNAALENGDQCEVVSDQLLIQRREKVSLNKLFNEIWCGTVALKCPEYVSFFRFFGILRRGPLFELIVRHLIKSRCTGTDWCASNHR